MEFKASRWTTHIHIEEIDEMQLEQSESAYLMFVVKEIVPLITTYILTSVPVAKVLSCILQSTVYFPHSSNL